MTRSREMDGAVPSVFVDIAGNAGVRAAVHAKFADNLTYSCAVGATHWDAPRPDADAGRSRAENVLRAGRGEEAHRRLGPGRLPAEGRRGVGGLPADGGDARRVWWRITGWTRPARCSPIWRLAGRDPKDGHVVRLG